MKKIFVLMLLTAIAFTGCKKEKIDKLNEKIIGKWALAERDNSSVPTNDKKVFTFVSTTKAYMSAALTSRPEMGSHWIDKSEVDVVIDGNKMTLTSHPDEQMKAVEEYTVTDITDMEFIANRKITVTSGGNVVLSDEDLLRFTRVTDDYSQAILGMWECKEIIGGETNNDDNARLEFFADGTYKFYRKNDDNVWSLVPRELNEYFVDGNFLATRWKAANEEMNYEWWKIDNIGGNGMQWAALRQNADGTTFKQSVEWQNVTPKTMLTGKDITGASFYGNVRCSYVYDADYRLVNIKAIQVDDNYVIRDLNLIYSDGHLSVNGVSEGYSLSLECTLDNQGRIIEMLRDVHSLTTDFTSNRTYKYTYYADGHLQTETNITSDGSVISTYVWENDELKLITTGYDTDVARDEIEFEPSDAPAQTLFERMGYFSDISELCTQGCFGIIPKHMPSKITLTVYVYGNPLQTTTKEYAYTVENGRISTIQEAFSGCTYTLHWGER